MAVICKNYKILFLATPKTGSTAVADFLIKYCHGEWLPKDNIIDNDGALRVDRKHCSILDLVENNLIDYNTIESYKIFTVTRNPYDWVISRFLHYHELCKKYEKEIEFGGPVHSVPRVLNSKSIEFFKTFKDMQLIDYIKWLKENNKTSIVDNMINGFDNIDILKFENLNNELLEYLRNNGVYINNILDFKNITKSKTDHYQTYYDESTRKIVEKLFIDDIKKYGYDY